MSRSHFTLAVALIVIAATLVFVKTFPEDATEPRIAQTKDAPRAKARSNTSSPDRFRSAKPLTPRPASTSHFDIGFDQATLAELTDEQRLKALGFAAKAEADARSTLDDLAAKYELTRQQQRDIFPIVAAHTGTYHPSMAVNGIAVTPAPVGSSLEESIHGNLDARQQAALTDAMIDDLEWWQEIVNQLEDDLDSAIDTGEVAVSTPTSPVTAPVTLDTAPAVGDGEAASHSGGNIFDLLNQGN